MKINNQNQYYLKIITYLLLGFSIGYFTKKETSNADAFDVSYISQDELIQLERERIRNQDIADRQLFFGKLDEAIKFIEQIANEKISNRNRVVFSQGIVSGDGVKSISNEVHEELISRLNRSSNGQNNETYEKYNNNNHDLYNLHEYDF